MNNSTTYLFSSKHPKSTPSVESCILVLFSKTNSDQISIYLSSAERDVRASDVSGIPISLYTTNSKLNYPISGLVFIAIQPELVIPLLCFETISSHF